MLRIATIGTSMITDDFIQVVNANDQAAFVGTLSRDAERVPTNVAWSLALTTWIKSSVIMDVPMVAIRSMYPPRAVRFTG